MARRKTANTNTVQIGGTYYLQKSKHRWNNGICIKIVQQKQDGVDMWTAEALEETSTLSVGERLLEGVKNLRPAYLVK